MTEVGALPLQGAGSAQVQTARNLAGHGGVLGMAACVATAGALLPDCTACLPAFCILPALCALPVLRVLRVLLQLDAFPATQVGLESLLLVLTSRLGATMLLECLILVLAMVKGAPAQVDLCAYPELQQSVTLVLLQVAFSMVQVGW